MKMGLKMCKKWKKYQVKTIYKTGPTNVMGVCTEFYQWAPKNLCLGSVFILGIKSLLSYTKKDVGATELDINLAAVIHLTWVSLHDLCYWRPNSVKITSQWNQFFFTFNSKNTKDNVSQRQNCTTSCIFLDDITLDNIKLRPRFAALGRNKKEH